MHPALQIGVELAQARLALAQRGHRLMSFGDFIAAHENPADTAMRIADRFVNELDIFDLVAAAQTQFHVAGDDGFAGRVYFIQQLEIPLTRQFRKHLAHGYDR